MGWATSNGTAHSVDNSLYAELLGKYVKGGVVDYQGFNKEEAKLDRYLDILAGVDTQTLSRNEQFAFYINAYNAWTIKLILSRYPDIKSIKELGGIFSSPWKKEICRIDGEMMTLDHIEHDILRPRFKDPRVHFVINCASKSCPHLIPEPYRGNSLEQQLDQAAKAFINNPRSNRIEGNTLFVSKIFKWFPEDFDHDVVGFFLKYGEGELKRELESKRDKIKIDYLHYDWSLNGK
jgi:hypothetical protein